ncbi:hypothetical protein ACLB2K_031369 [Fragaria x ananassa]
MAFLGVSSSSCSKNSMSNSSMESQNFSIVKVTRSFAASLDLASSLALANLKVVNLSDRVFVPPKKKRRRHIGSRNKKGQKKMQEEEKSPTITPPPAVISHIGQTERGYVLNMYMPISNLIRGLLVAQRLQRGWVLRG